MEMQIQSLKVDGSYRKEEIQQLLLYIKQRCDIKTTVLGIIQM